MGRATSPTRSPSKRAQTTASTSGSIEPLRTHHRHAELAGDAGLSEIKGQQGSGWSGSTSGGQVNGIQRSAQCLLGNDGRFGTGDGIQSDQSKGVKILGQLTPGLLHIAAVEKSGQIWPNLNFGQPAGDQNRLTGHDVDGNSGIVFVDVAL